MRSQTSARGLTVCLLMSHAIVPASLAQPGGPPPPQVVCPEVAPDRQITFRVLAPKAEVVQLGSSGDIPGIGFGQAKAMTRGTNGIWEVTVGPLPPGAYRYNFNVDGVNVIDPRNPRTSESNENTWSLVQVPGADWLDTKDVPHGAVAEVTYWSSTLKRFRRLHVYTPPGYESGPEKYPILYLLHGAFDSDHSWSSVGRAGFILDDAGLKQGLKLFWFATGKDDFLVQTSRATVEMLRKHKFDVIYKETDGGHTWDNWRAYLHEFSQKLFQ